MILTLFGLAGTGTTTVGKAIAKELDFYFISTGTLFREEASNRGISLLELEALANNNRSIDEALDMRIEALGKERDNVVIESRLAWHFIPHSIKIALTCGDEERIRRIAHRDTISEEQAKKDTHTRETAINKRFEEYYGIVDVVNDLSRFDYIVDTTDCSADEAMQSILFYINTTNRGLKN